jgi:hypothetical protein
MERLAGELARERFSWLRAEQLAYGGAAAFEPALQVAAALERRRRRDGAPARPCL